MHRPFAWSSHLDYQSTDATISHEKIAAAADHTNGQPFYSRPSHRGSNIFRRGRTHEKIGRTSNSPGGMKRHRRVEQNAQARTIGDGCHGTHGVSHGSKPMPSRV